MRLFCGPVSFIVHVGCGGVLLPGVGSADGCYVAGDLRHIQTLRPWDLRSVLKDKYEWPDEEAESFADFLLPMLAFDQDQRASAADCLLHPWLRPN